jgi:peptide/nickel transport system substrate-binding protein
MNLRLPALALLLTAGGCDGEKSSDAPLVVSAVGARAAPGDPSSMQLDEARRVLMGATAQGLVRFDAAGQIEPGLAESWTVLPDGLSYIFRIREAEWSDGSPVTTEQVVRVLKRAAAPGSRNPLAPFLKVVDDIVAMTDRVIEVRLTAPRPDLLKLFAQPELAVFRLDLMTGSGPFRVQPDPAGGAVLIPAVDPDHGEDERVHKPRPADFVRLRGERAALAVARFAAGRSDAVLGGGFVDWPIVTVAKIDANAVKMDPVAGLFGFGVASRGGFLADPANRAALAMAIDRAALTRAFRPDWTPVETLLPARFDSAAAPAVAAWVAQPLDVRRALAQARVRSWKRVHAGPVTIRIALPAGPGGTLVWGTVAASLIAIGVQPVRVGMGDAAELRLVDAVAPYDSARWFLASACRPCSAEPLGLIEAARDAASLAERSARIAEADAALATDAAYIPIAQPLRWSIVTNRVNGWQGNARGWHPLNHLRNESE